MVTNVAERKRILKTSGRCFVCLKKHHISRDCRSTLKCSKCNGRHHVSICSGEPSRPATITQPSATNMSLSGSGSLSVQPTTQSSTSTKNTPTTTTSMHCNSHSVPILLQTAHAHVFKCSNPEKIREIRLIFDSGSQRSYVTDRLVDSLSLNCHHIETMVIKTFRSSKGSKQTCKVVNVGLKLKDGRMLELSLLSVPLICESFSCQPMTYVQENLAHIASLSLADHSYDQELDIDILIGSDQYWKLVTGQVIRKGKGPVAVDTKLGWVLSGPISEESYPDSLINIATTHSMMIDAYVPEESSQELDNRLKMFWDLESFGVNQNESSVYQEFQKEVTHKGNKYEVSLPWKQSHPALPDHYDLALWRLNGLLKRLRQNTELLHQYDNVI